MQQLTWICRVRGSSANWTVPQGCSEVEFLSAAACTWFCIHSVCGRTTVRVHHHHHQWHSQLGRPELQTTEVSLYMLPVTYFEEKFNSRCSGWIH